MYSVTNSHTGISPAARSKVLRRVGPCDSPRVGIGPSTLGRSVVRRGCASGETARGGGIGPDRWRDSVDWPARATIGELPADSLGCNIEPADAAAGKAVHTLSRGKGAVGKTLGFACEKNEDTLESGPREVLLPKVKPRREALTSHRGVLMRSRLLLTAHRAKLDHNTLSQASRAGYYWPEDCLGLRSDPLAAAMARLGRNTDTLNSRY